MTARLRRSSRPGASSSVRLLRRIVEGLARLLAVCAATGIVRVRVACAEPSIAVTDVPPFKVAGTMAGVVTAPDPTLFDVAGYIQIEGLGFYTKPTFLFPSVGVDPDGHFTLNVTTGGLDAYATILCASLIPHGSVPPSASGAAGVPDDPNRIAMDCVERHGRTIVFAGITWAVKEAPQPVGPGANRFSADPADVFVDAQDRLHLTVTFRDGFWWATEVIALETPGRGIFFAQTESNLEALDRQVTFGVFTWDPYGDEDAVPGAPNREIDVVEDARWCNGADPTTSQETVQPYYVPGNLTRYALPSLGAENALTRFADWRADTIYFAALRGLHSPCDFPGDSVIHEQTYVADPSVSHFIPSGGRAALRLNLWPANVEIGGPLCQPAPPRPADGERVEVIVTAAGFIASCDATTTTTTSSSSTSSSSSSTSHPSTTSTSTSSSSTSTKPSSTTTSSFSTSSSSSSTSHPSTTSTSASTTSTTTATTSTSSTTTVPPCGAAIDFSSVRCRLDELAMLTRRLVDGPLEARLLNDVSRSRDALARAEELSLAGRPRQARAKVLDALRALTNFAHRATSLAARRTIPRASRELLLAAARSLRTQVEQLR